jgi:hypothetical protein
MIPHKYPSLIKAVIEIAYDSGVIYRGVTEESVVNHVMHLVEERYAEADIKAVDIALSKLSPAELEEFCCGETPDPVPFDLWGAQELLNFAFEVM